MKTHILHVIDSLAIGGAERMLVEIANQTNRTQFKVSVCVTRADTTLASELKPHIQVFVLNRKNRFDIKGIKRFAALLKQKNVDILHVHGRSSFAFTVFATLLCLINPTVILHDHRSIEIEASIPTWFRIWGKQRLDCYIAVYQRLVAWARAAGIRFSKINVIENALDLTRILRAKCFDIKKHLKIPEDTLVGLFVGGLRREKGLDILIKAVSKSRYHKKAKFIVVGSIQNEPYVQACKEAIEKCGLGDTILFLGPRKEVPSILKSVDFAVLPSISESGPLVLIEYMASGLPFVASRVGAISLRADELGVPGFVPPNDAEAFSKALDEILGLSSADRASRGAIGREIAFRYFDIRKKMPQWYQVYNRVLHKEHWH